MAKRHFYLQWDSTNNCNLRCKHCYHGREDSPEQEKNSMTLDEVKLMIDDLEGTSERWGMRPRIGISGGECILREDLYDILEYTHQKKIITNLLTNGTLLTPKKSEEIKKRGVNSLQISIDGTRETHNRIRQKEYAFDRAIEGIRNATNAKIGVVVAMTATKENEHEFEEVIKISYQAGANKVTFKTYVPSLDLGEQDPLYLNASEIHRLISHTTELTKKYKGQIQVLHSDVLFQILEPENPLIEQAKEEDKFLWGCSAGFRSLSVLSDGSVYPCRRLPIYIGHINEGISKIVLENEVMKNLRDLERMKANTLCDKVSHCRGCRAVAYAVTKDYMAKDPMCFKELIEIGK